MSGRTQAGSTRRSKPTGMVALIGLILLAAAAILHVGIGAKFISPGTVMDALLRFDPTKFEHKIIVELRLLRLIAGVAAGAALGVSGAILQSVIRNPLGEPHVLGLNAGAALAVVVMIVAGLPLATHPLARPLVAAGGAGLLFGLVLTIASAGRSGPTPLKVTLCGVALSAFAASLTSALLILDEQTTLDLRLWLAGDLAGLDYPATIAAAGFIAVGLLLALILSPQLNALQLGDAAATGLGVRVKRARLMSLATVALLCGAAISIVGPIGFVGLVVPLALRRTSGGDMRSLVPLAAIAGAALLLGADILARQLLAPQELATGIMTALIGAPVFIFLAGRHSR